jgi:Tfp pilus assembly protein PilF
VATFLSPTWAQSEPAVVYSKNSEANALFLKAREYLAKSDPRTGGKLANAREAIKLIEQAVEKDPSFALAYVELSRAWTSLTYSDPDGATNEEILPPARAAALKAVQLDPKLPEAHLGLASLAFSVDYDWDTAEREYKLALQLQPITLRLILATPLI